MGDRDQRLARSIRMKHRIVYAQWAEKCVCYRSSTEMVGISDKERLLPLGFELRSWIMKMDVEDNENITTAIRTKRTKKVLKSEI